MTEDDLRMIRIQSGESAAFEELVELYQGPLLGFFFRNTRDRQLSEDLAQETLLRVYNQSWDYLPRGQFRGWMYRIARNLLIDNVRRQSHDALVRAVKGKGRDDDDRVARIADEFLPPEDRVHAQEFANLIDELLEQLPEEQRVTFTLHHFADLSLPEVSEVMDTTLPTCKSRLRLAREKLQEKLRVRGITSPHSAGA